MTQSNNKNTKSEQNKSIVFQFAFIIYKREK